MNSTIKYAVGSALAILSLAVVVPTAQTQNAPGPTFRTNGLTIVPDNNFVPPVVIGPNGMQPVMPGNDPYGYYNYNNYNSDYIYTPNTYNVSFGANDIPRTSDTITTRKEANNRLYMRWQGEPRAVRTITFALLDASNRVIRQQTITDLPAEARLTRTAKTTAYSVTVNYINGTNTSVVSPL